MQRGDNQVYLVGAKAEWSPTRGCNGFDRDHEVGEAIRKPVR